MPFVNRLSPEGTVLFAQNAFCAGGRKEVLTPHQREVKMRSRALPATAGGRWARISDQSFAAESWWIL